MVDADLAEARRLGRRIAAMETRLKRLEVGSRSAQLTHSSIDDGHLEVRDDQENVRQVIGKQPDGRFAASARNGPPPPVPTAPTVAPDTLGLTLTWDGTFVAAARPSDFAHVRIHVSDTSGVTGLVAGILAEAGQLTISPLVVEPKFVVLTAVSTSGAVSDPSAEVSATPLEVVASDLLDGIVTELKLANDAVTAAKIAADAVGTAEIQGQAVTLSELADGSVDASKILFDARDIGAITVFRQATAPTVDLKVGDLWFDTANDNRVSRWDGTAWVATTLGTAAITAGSVTAALIAANTITAQQIAAGAIAADEIAANAVIAGKIAANAVIAGKIAADAVLAGNIAVDAVQAGNIAVDAVTAREILALSVTAGELAANAVVAGKIAAGAITAEKLEAILVLANTILAGSATGGRVELGFGTGDASSMVGIHARAPDGQTITFMLNAETGEVFLKGRTEFGAGSLLENDYIDLFEQSTGAQTPALRQSRHVGTSGSGFAIVTWPSETQLGNLLLMYVLAEAEDGGTPPTFSVSADWTLVETVTNTTGSLRLSLFYIPDAAATRNGESIAPDEAVFMTVGLFEYTGIDAAPLDQSASAAGAGSTVDSGTTPTTTQADELWFAVGGAFEGNSLVTFSDPSNSFTNIGSVDSTDEVSSVAAHRNVTATGQASTSWSAGRFTQWVGVIATFQAAMGTGDPNVTTPDTVRVYAKERNGETELHSINSGGVVRVLGNDAVFLGEVELSVDAPGFTFSSIDQNYRDLLISIRANRVNDPDAFQSITMWFNNVTAIGSYDWSWNRNLQNGANSESFVSNDTKMEIGALGRATSNMELTIHGYSRAGIKVVRSMGWANSAGVFAFTIAGGRYNNSEPVTRLDLGLFLGDYGSGSGVQLWGIGKLV